MIGRNKKFSIDIGKVTSLKVLCVSDPARSSTNKLARPDLGHAQTCTVSSREFISPRLESLCGPHSVGAGGLTWPHFCGLPAQKWVREHALATPSSGGRGCQGSW